MSVEKRRPPLTMILLWTAGAVTLVLTGYGIFTGVVLDLPFPYNYLLTNNYQKSLTMKKKTFMRLYGITLDMKKHIRDELKKV